MGTAPRGLSLNRHAERPHVGGPGPSSPTPILRPVCWPIPATATTSPRRTPSLDRSLCASHRVGRRAGAGGGREGSCHRRCAHERYAASPAGLGLTRCLEQPGAGEVGWLRAGPQTRPGRRQRPATPVPVRVRKGPRRGLRTLLPRRKGEPPRTRFRDDSTPRKLRSGLCSLPAFAQWPISTVASDWRPQQRSYSSKRNRS